MSEFAMLVYREYDQVEPELIRYTGDRQGAIDYAKGENAFEVDIYEGDGVRPDSKSVCAVMYNGMVMEG